MKTNKFFFMLALILLGGISNAIAQGGNHLATTDNSSIGLHNTFVGVDAGINNTSNSNSGFGMSSLLSNITGGFNSAMGVFSLASNTDGYFNCAFGSRSMEKNVSGFGNTAVGMHSLGSLTKGESNIALGYAAGFYVAPDNYNFNIAIGVNTPRNFGLGTNPGGRENIFIGNETAQYLNSGDYNLIIGSNIELFNGPSTNLVAGNDTSNTIILADGKGRQRFFINGTNGFAGVGLADNNIPQNRLELGRGLNGTAGLRFRFYNSGSPTVEPNGKVLTLNEDGDVVLTTDEGSGGSTVIDDGLNTEVEGSGVAADPYKINAKNIYTHDGAITTTTGLRTVTMGNNNLFFNTNGSNFTNGTSGSGRVYIGSTMDPFSFPSISATSRFRLMVEGGILTERVKVALRTDTVNWADYVFADDYKLMPLNELETFVKDNNHLPGIESASELAEKGLDLGDMQAKQMGKIEELTLYVIEQNKALEKQSKEIEELKAQMKALIEKNNK